MTADTTFSAGETERAAREITIKVTNLSISYTTHSNRAKRRGMSSRERVQVDALTDISFVVHRGESMGLVGRNGAGKSTLLRAVAGTCAPSKGEILVSEQPQLLGVKAAMMAKLSGRHNIELGLLSLGFSGDEITELTEQVAEFTELGYALNRPMKTYSSGMRARLAFSIATVVQPPILLLDEALSVGDAQFKKRSMRRLKAIRKNAGVIMIASHNINEIRRTCDRAIWLERGHMMAEGPATEIIEQYQAAYDGEHGEDDGNNNDDF